MTKTLNVDFFTRTTITLNLFDETFTDLLKLTKRNPPPVTTLTATYSKARDQGLLIKAGVSINFFFIYIYFLQTLYKTNRLAPDCLITSVLLIF